MIKKAIKLVTGLLITFLVASLLQMFLLIENAASQGITPPTVTDAFFVALSSIDRDIGQGAVAREIRVRGADFQNGAIVSFTDGITVNSTTFDSSTQLRANIDVAAGATVGTHSVIVTNPDGGAGTGIGLVTVNAGPTVTGANPNQLTPGVTNQTVTITGTNFVGSGPPDGIVDGQIRAFHRHGNVTFGAGITVNLVPGFSLCPDCPTFVSATQLTVSINIAIDATVGNRNMTVTNPDGGSVTFGVTVGTVDGNVSGGDHNTGQGFAPGSSNNAFFRFQLNNFASTADFNSLNFAITGSYQSTDIVNFKLWSSTDNTFESASDTLLATDTTISGNGETVNFTAFSNTVSQTTTHYFVTVDLAATASGADNIAGAITASGDIGFASGTSVSGTFPISGSDHSLPVELSAFSGTITQEGVLLKWRTESETNNLGFHVYRSETKDGEYVRITPRLIKGQGSDSTLYDYSFLDETAEEGQSYWYLIEDIDFSGITEKSDPIQVGFSRKAVPLKVLPAHFALYQNYPNPFNPETWFPYDLAEQANVEITIYNASGKQIRTLSLGAQPAGKYLTKDRAAYWDGRSDTDERVSSGIYYYHFRAGDYSATKKMIILK